jgi:HemY protein
MIARLLFFLLILAILAAFGVWLADHPGRVAIDWLDYRADTTVAVLVLLVLLLAIALGLVWRVARFVWNAPARVSEFRRRRRERRGYRALAEGFFAAASGEAGLAEKHAREAADLKADARLTSLLAAQAAELDGDRDRARKSFQALVAVPETELAGLRGLLAIARRGGANEEALGLARRAKALKPGVPWALEALLELELRAGHWDDADKTLEEAVKRRVVDGQRGRRLRAAIRAAQSEAAERLGDAARALELARAAHDVQPSAPGPAARYAALLAAGGDARKARRVVEEAWRAEPHAILLAPYRAALGTAEALPWAQAVQKLVAGTPEAPEGRLALAEAALEARLWGVARDALAALPPDDAQRRGRALRLRARLEAEENGDRKTAAALEAEAGRARDPQWQCVECGAVAPDWSAACGNCGAVDSLVWRVPGPRGVILPANGAR